MVFCMCCVEGEESVCVLLARTAISYSTDLTHQPNLRAAASTDPALANPSPSIFQQNTLDHLVNFSRPSFIH